jgi:hypothetical protein
MSLNMLCVNTWVTISIKLVEYLDFMFYIIYITRAWYTSKLVKQFKFIDEILIDNFTVSFTCHIWGEKNKPKLY